MKTLVCKELGRVLPSAVVVGLVLTVLYASLYGVKSALLVPPSALMPIVLLLAVNVGALIGYGQLANERHAGTLSLLLQRSMAPGALIVAKCAAAWTFLALVVHVPLVLFALWESASSPLGPVLQVGRVGELLLLGLICVPGHALGLFCATLPVSIRLQAVFLPLTAQGLVLLAVLFLWLPIAGQAASTALFLVGIAVLSWWLLTAARDRLTLLDDQERPEGARGLGSQLAFLALVLLVPGCLLLSMAQHAILELSTADRQSIAWHADHGPVLIQRVAPMDWTVRSPGGELLPGVPVDPSWALFRGYGGDWVRLWWWSEDRTPQDLLSSAEEDHRAEPCLAPEWDEVTSATIGIEGSTLEMDVRAFFEQSAGSISILYTLHAGRVSLSSRVRTSTPPEIPSLYRLVRGDGQPFSPRSRATTLGQDLRVEDPGDGTVWHLLLADTPPAFTRASRLDVYGLSEDSPSEPSVHAVVEGDLLACTVRVVENATGEVLMTHHYGPSDSVGRGTQAFLFGSTLCLPPALLLGSHAFAGERSRWNLSLGGLLVGRGRRLWLVLSSLGVGLFLANAVQRGLRRRGAETWRRRTWMCLILALGPAGWLLFLALEPRASIAPVSRSTRASLRILSETAVLG